MSRCKKGRCYSVFVDFTKTFDRIPHNHLFYMLYQKGAHGRLLQVLKDMYSKLKSCVTNGIVYSELFECSVGTRQGCIISPFLFIFYLNELIEMCRDIPGVYLDEYHPNVNMLLYADDLVIIGKNVANVQEILNVLKVFCAKWGLDVNLSKTKAMIYRKGGIVKENERFYYGEREIENVSYYKYLGVLISTRLSWSPAQKQLVIKAERASYSFYEILYECNFPVKVGLFLYSKCIVPILTYGSELFGSNVHKCIEMFLLKFLRKLLGVGRNTHGEALRGECGQHRMHVFCVVKCIKYWIRLLSQEEGTLLYSCYKYLYTKCEEGKQNWVTSVKNVLETYGLGNIFESQNVLDNDFIKEFENRVKDCELQNWSRIINESSKLYFYAMYKTKFELEQYFELNLPRNVQIQLSKFRLSAHRLEIEIGRHYNIPREDRLCRLCGNVFNTQSVECEFHFLFECPLYEDFRQNCNNLSFEKTLYNFKTLMSCNDVSKIKSLAFLIWKCFSYRNDLYDAV